MIHKDFQAIPSNAVGGELQSMTTTKMVIQHFLNFRAFYPPAGEFGAMATMLFFTRLGTKYQGCESRKAGLTLLGPPPPLTQCICKLWGVAAPPLFGAGKTEI